MEFFTSFEFDVTNDLDALAIRFRLFDNVYEMSLTEWCVRLGLVTIDEALSAEFQRMECGIPGKHVQFDEHAAWRAMTHPQAEPLYHAAQARGFNFVDPVLRMCQTFLGVNLLGQTTCFSRVSLPELYFLYRMREGRKVNLGFWIAYQFKSISSHTARNLTLCHLLGVLIQRNFIVKTSSDCPTLLSCPAPGRFDLLFLKSTGIVQVVDGEDRFYTPGEANEPRTAARAQVAQATEERLAGLEGQVVEMKQAVEGLKAALAEFMMEIWNATGSTGARASSLPTAQHEKGPQEKEMPKETPTMPPSEPHHEGTSRTAPKRRRSTR